MSKKKVKKQNCPIGIEDCFYKPSPSGKRLICINYWNCEDLTKAWDIPYKYYFDSGKIPCLVVKSSGHRVTRWEKVSTNQNMNCPRCFIPSGYYEAPPYDNWQELEFSQRIKKTWADYGWKAAIPIN